MVGVAVFIIWVEWGIIYNIFHARNHNFILQLSYKLTENAN
jgi:hypothetical protein